MKDKEDRNGARRYMAEELYVGNTGYPYLTSCSGDFLYSIHRASYTEDENGTIEVEKNADFVVLEKDIYKIDPDEIKTTKVDMTVLGGEIVYERKVEE